MKGVLLVNMGGANSPAELKLFLTRMFKDPFILPFGKLGRNLLSFIISNTRYKKSWKKYELIGGSPIIDATKKTVEKLQLSLGSQYRVQMAFSYSQPFIKDSITDFINVGINEIIIIPLYPQASLSTTSSVEADAKNTISQFADLKVSFIREFYKHQDFIAFWSNLILKHIKEKNIAKPVLVFSAHSIPESLVAKGDTYAEAIKTSSGLIAEKCGLEYKVAFQSGMGKNWLKPASQEILKQLATEQVNEILLIPISFVNENLETLYDIDKEIIPYAKEVLGIKNISKVEIPVANDDFIKLLKSILEDS